MDRSRALATARSRINEIGAVAEENFVEDASN
jgi:hypothetical protein